MTYDVIIAGGGPSGSYLGYILSKAGLKIAILEKEKFPRDKPCGGGISPKALKLLPFDLSPVVEQKISKGILSFGNEKIIVRDKYEYFGIVINRSDFDSFLMDQAIRAGSDFYDNHHVSGMENGKDRIIIKTSGNDFQSKVLVGADGANSTIRRTIFPEHKIFSVPSLMAKIPLSHAAMDIYNGAILFDFGIIDHGYGWIFPLKNEVNIGIYSPYPKKKLSTYLEKLIDLYPGLKNENLKVEAARIPLENLRKNYQKNKVFLVGDAAGLCESFFGEGIYNSLKSAEIASKHIQRNFNKTVFDNSYSREIRNTFSSELYFSRVLAKIFYYNLKKSYHFIVRNDYISDLFARTLAGKLSYKGLFYKAVFTAPYWLSSRRTPVESGLVI